MRNSSEKDTNSYLEKIVTVRNINGESPKKSPKAILSKISTKDQILLKELNNNQNDSNNFSLHSISFAQNSPKSLRHPVIIFDKDLSMIKSDDMDNSFIDRSYKIDHRTPRSKSSINIGKYMYIFSDNKDINVSYNKKHHIPFLDYEGDLTNYK